MAEICCSALQVRAICALLQAPALGVGPEGLSVSQPQHAEALGQAGLEKLPRYAAWVSCSCQDERRTCHGEDFAEEVCGFCAVCNEDWEIIP
jgi:hypothetical protein